MFCAHQDLWNQEDAKFGITFDRFISAWNKTTPSRRRRKRSQLSGSNNQPLELTTGLVFITKPGFYSISFSGYSQVDPAKEHRIYLDHNGDKIYGTTYIASTNKGNYKINGHGSWSIVGFRD